MECERKRARKGKGLGRLILSAIFLISFQREKDSRLEKIWCSKTIRLFVNLFFFIYLVFTSIHCKLYEIYSILYAWLLPMAFFARTYLSSLVVPIWYYRRMLFRLLQQFFTKKRKINLEQTLTERGSVREEIVLAVPLGFVFILRCCTTFGLVRK